MNTFKHIGLYEALGWTPPAHGHLPLVFNMDSHQNVQARKGQGHRAADKSNLQGVPTRTTADYSPKPPVVHCPNPRRIHGQEIRSRRNRRQTRRRHPHPNSPKSTSRTSAAPATSPKPSSTSSPSSAGPPASDREILSADQHARTLLPRRHPENPRPVRPQKTRLDERRIHPQIHPRPPPRSPRFLQRRHRFTPSSTPPRQPSANSSPCIRNAWSLSPKWPKTPASSSRNPSSTPRPSKSTSTTTTASSFLNQIQAILRRWGGHGTRTASPPPWIKSCCWVRSRGAAAQPLRVALSGAASPRRCSKPSPCSAAKKPSPASTWAPAVNQEAKARHAVGGGSAFPARPQCEDQLDFPRLFPQLLGNITYAHSPIRQFVNGLIRTRFAAGAHPAHHSQPPSLRATRLTPPAA